MIQRDIELGYGTVTKSAMQDRHLTIEAKAILAYLSSFAGGKDEAWPSVKKMCYDLNVSDARLRKHITLLIEEEYIDKYRCRDSKSKEWSNNVYSILK